MAFNCSFSNITATTAIFSASFSGGDADYANWRMVKLVIFDPNATSNAFDDTILSSNKGTGSSSFNALIQGLKPDTEYGWKAELGYGPSNIDPTKITWLGKLDEEGGTIKYTASGSFDTQEDGTTASFVCNEMEIEKNSINFYASYTYDATVTPHVTELNKLTIIYTKDPAMATGLTTVRFDNTGHTPTSDTEGIYEWDGSSITIGGLKAGTTYYWRAYCGSQAQAGSVTGIIESNTTTLPPEPNALSLKILSIGPTKAVLTATYYDAETASLSDYSTLHYKFSSNGGSSWGSYSTCAGIVDTEHHLILFKTDLIGLSTGASYIYRAYVGSTDPWG